MTMPSVKEAYETIGMVKLDKLDIRATTLGINLLRAADPDPKKLRENIAKLLWDKGKDLVNKAQGVEDQYGIPIANKRVTITPISLVLNACLTGNKEKDFQIALDVAKTLDESIEKLGVDFMGGFGAQVEHGIGYADQVVMESLPDVLNQTQRICSFVNVGTTKAGLNMRAIAKMGSIIHEISKKEKGYIGCMKLVVFCNAVPDNPFLAGGFHGVEMPDEALNIGISGPGVVRRVIENLPKGMALDELSDAIKKTAFKLTRAGELIGREVAKSICVPFGSIDLSLAPTTEEGDSVGEILECMGLERVGTHGTTAALALLTDAVKKGGIMASSSIGGLSGAFIPVAEDTFLANAARDGVLTMDKMEALTSICSVGLDMIPIPGDTRSTTIAGIIADESAIGMMNHKTTAVRVIPVQGKKAGEYIEFGGLFGGGYIMPLHTEKADQFIWRKGQIPGTITGFRN